MPLFKKPSKRFDLGIRRCNVPPDIERQLKTGDEDSLVNLASSVAQGMFTC